MITSIFLNTPVKLESANQELPTCCIKIQIALYQVLL